MVISINYTRITSILTIEISLLIVFTSSIFLLFTWGLPAGYYLLISIGSFFGGVIAAEVDVVVIVVVAVVQRAGVSGVEVSDRVVPVAG